MDLSVQSLVRTLVKLLLRPLTTLFSILLSSNKFDDQNTWKYDWIDAVDFECPDLADSNLHDMSEASRSHKL